jgi:hypothetical protein
MNQITDAVRIVCGETKWTPELVETLAGFLEDAKDEVCPCEAIRQGMRAYLYSEPLPEAAVSAPRCHSCDVVARALGQVIEADWQGYLELTARAIEGDPLALTLTRFLPNTPISRSVQ